jgi:hypothetical protein
LLRVTTAERAQTCVFATAATTAAAAVAAATAAAQNVEVTPSRIASPGVEVCRSA